MKLGIALHREEVESVAPKKYIHHETNSWIITSDVPIREMLNANVLSKALPGLLGCYVLPSDSLLSFRDVKSEHKKVLERWKSIQKEESSRTHNGVHRVINHFTLDEVHSEELKKGDDLEDDEEYEFLEEPDDCIDDFEEESVLDNEDVAAEDDVNDDGVMEWDSD